MASKSLDKILSNISWLLGDKVLDIILRVTVGVLVARYLGVEWFGYLHFSLAMVALLIPVAKLGLNSIVVKYLALEPERKGELLGTAFAMQFVMSMLLSTGLATAIYFFSTGQETTDLLVTILAITLIFQCADPFVSWNQSQVSAKYTVWANRISLAIGMTIRLSFIYFSVEFIYFVWAWVIESILKAVFLFHFYMKRETVSIWMFERKTAAKLLKESWPMMFSGIAAIVYLKIDVVMLGSMLEGKDVGLYSAAVRISEIFYFLPTIVSATLLPAIVRSSKLDELAFNQRIQALIDGLALYSIVAIVFLWFGAELLINTLFGIQYSESAFILKIHAFALLFVATGTSRDKMLIAENRTIFIMVSTFIGAVINIALNLYLMPRYGGVGAAIATVISYAFSGYFACIFWRPTIKHFKMITASFFVLFRPSSLYNYLSTLRD